MTTKERRHTNRILRVFKIALKQLEALTQEGIENDTYPKTTQKAFAETFAVFANAQARIVTGNANVV